MIPFSSVIPPGSGIPDAGGQTAGSAGVGKKGPVASCSEEASNFWSWLLQLADSSAAAGVDALVGADPQAHGTPSEASDWGPFLSLITNAAGPAAGLTGDAPTVPDNRPKDLADLIRNVQTPPERTQGEALSRADRAFLTLPAIGHVIQVAKPSVNSREPLAVIASHVQNGDLRSGGRPAERAADGQIGDQAAGRVALAGQSSDGQVQDLAGNVNRLRPSSAPLGAIGDEEKTKSANQQPSVSMGRQISSSRQPAGAIGIDADDGSADRSGQTTHAVGGKEPDAIAEKVLSAQKTAAPVARLSPSAGDEGEPQMGSSKDGQTPQQASVRGVGLNTAEATEYEKFSEPAPEVGKRAAGEPTRLPDDITAAAKAPHVSKASPATTPVLHRTDVPAARTFANTVIDQIVATASLRSTDGRNQIQIRLKPEFLGNVQMSITAAKEQMVVRMVTDQIAVKEVIESNLQQLKTELQNQGLIIDRIDILVNPDTEQQSNRDPFSQMFKHSSSQNGQKQGRDERSPSDDQEQHGRPEEDSPSEEGINYFA